MRSEGKRTPGPWIVNEYPKGYGIEHVEDSKNWPVHGSVAFVDRVIGEASYPEQAKANAEFIAKACNSHDELLHQLKDLHREFYSHRIGEVTDNKCSRCAAIAKAEAKSEPR